MPWVRPKPEDVESGHIYPGHGGFRYSLRNAEGRVIYENTHGLRSRFEAREEIKKRYGVTPDKITMGSA